MSSPAFITTLIHGLLRALVPAPRPGTYEPIGNGEGRNRKERSSRVQVTAVEGDWVRYELLPLGSFAPRSMEIAAFNLSFRRVREP